MDSYHANKSMKNQPLRYFLAMMQSDVYISLLFRSMAMKKVRNRSVIKSESTTSSNMITGSAACSMKAMRTGTKIAV